MTIAYHFVGSTLRDGRPVPEDNFKLVHEGPVKICNSGLHASLSAFDAMLYVPGNVICKVHCSGIVESHDDKFVCRERTILQRFDATELMDSFSRECALSVIHLWDAPEIVIKYLKTGDPELRDPAMSAAMSAAWDAADAAWDAAWSAAMSAAMSAAWDAADAAWAADAARDAAWSAARDAADAARDAALDAADAARDAAKKNQKAMFDSLVEDRFKG